MTNPILNPSVDVSQGIPIGNAAAELASVSPDNASGSPQDAQTPQGGSPDNPQTDPAIVERLRQQNAKLAKLVGALGLDPMSDIPDQLEKGLITPEMVAAHIASRIQPQPAPTAQPVASQPDVYDPVAKAEAEYRQYKELCDKEGRENGTVSFETLQKYNEAVLRLQEAKASAVLSRIEAETQQKQYQQALDTVLGVLKTNPVYQALPADSKQELEFAHVAITSALADQEARRLGLDPARLTAQQYQYFAQKAAEKIQKIAMVNSSQAGKFSAPTVPPAQPGFVPAGTGGQAIPPVNPYAKANLQNHRQLAQMYLKQIKQL